jgi:hypothetical protein
MKRAGLQRSKFMFRVSQLLVTLLVVYAFNLTTPESALAANIGSGNCIQTVDSVSDVTVVESGGFCYVAFKAGTRQWTTPAGTTSIDFLIVAGGGSGGSRHAGGGGAGGLLRGTSISISGVTALNISVGAGAPAPSRISGYNYIVGEKGSDSFLSKNSGTGGFTTRTAIGGGGGSAGGSAAQYGGSGGGSQSSTVSTFESGQGSAGGTGGYSAGYWYSAGGGGGAGGVGLNHTSTSGGAGGPGAIWISDFTTTIATNLGLPQTRQVSGNQVYFAGGGGGSTTSTTAGSGGLGGGGAAVLGNSTGESGGVNSGGGGGGSGCCDGGTPGAGGSGLIIIRYVADTTAPTITGPSSATGLTSAISIAENSTTVHTFTANETVSWTKSGTDGSFFAISSGGVLTITARDFESAADNGSNNTYILAITATDTAGNLTTQTLTVSITDINEAPTISTNASATTYAFSQAENQSSVITYSGTDIDAGSSLSWSISGSDASDFSIVSGTGVLSFSSNPDFEAPADSDINNTYIVVVSVSDGALTDTQTLTVTITDMNEPSSLGAPSISGTVYKGVTTTITVTSNAAGKVRFFISGKRIPNCLSVATTGSRSSYIATCSWKSAVQGRQSLSASITPSLNTFSAASSARTEIFILKRSGSRS